MLILNPTNGFIAISLWSRYNRHVYSEPEYLPDEFGELEDKWTVWNEMPIHTVSEDRWLKHNGYSGLYYDYENYKVEP